MFELVTLIFAIFVIYKLTTQADRIRGLETEVRSLKQELRGAPPVPGAAESDPVKVQPTAYPGTLTTSAVTKPSPPRDAAPFRPPDPGPPEREGPAPLFDRLSAQTQQEWEALVGERLLNRIGALALILASGFFVKYAFDREWISPALRVLIGAFAGTGLIMAASRQRTRLPVFAQGLLGTGISVLYLSAYASFAFYQLISVPVAFVLMALVTAIGFERAVRFESKGVGLLNERFLAFALLAAFLATGAYILRRLQTGARDEVDPGLAEALWGGIME
ncbi:MAG: DUF2339 domain-containing protein [Actinomycetota bacterium]